MTSLISPSVTSLVFPALPRSHGVIPVDILIQTTWGLFPHLCFQAHNNIFPKLEWGFLRPLVVLGSQQAGKQLFPKHHSGSCMASCGFFLDFSGGKVSHCLCFSPFPSSVEIGSFRGICGFNVSVVVKVFSSAALCCWTQGRLFPCYVPGRSRDKDELLIPIPTLKHVSVV